MTTPKTPPKVMDELPALRRYALSLTRHGADAEDLVHDALVRALERGSGYRPEGSLRGWLMSILHNLHIDRLRSGKSAAGRDRALADEVEERIAPSQVDSVRLSQVRRAFDDLPVEQREALHLVTIEGLSYDEAAVILDVPSGTVMSRVSRGREALRRWEAGPSLRLVKGGE